jgi:hypothetical protein
MAELVSADIAPLVQMFEEAEQSTREAREKSERDRDYYDNKQWTSTEEATLGKRHQPVVTYNRIQRKVNFLSGLEKQQRKDPKAFPVTPDDQDAADAATDALRFVCQKEKWDKKRSGVWKNLLVEGTGAVLVDVKPIRSKGGLYGSTALQAPQAVQYDPSLTWIRWDRFFYDPMSADQHFDDANYMGIVTWYDYDVAARKWSHAKDALDGSLAQAQSVVVETYEDKPKHGYWADPVRKRVRVIELYHREGDGWSRCVFTFGGYLEPKAPSPYLDEEGRPENPIKAASLYVDRDNNRYGEVRVLISPQDVVNKTHSKWMHFNNMRQVRVGLGASEDAEKIRKELARPDGIVRAEKDDFEILPTADLAAAQFNMLQMSMNEIDKLGANAALQGKNENDMSGRAILAQQQGGMVEVADPFDVLRELTLSVYQAVWNRIRQVWTDERWIRVTDDERNLRFVGLNQKVTVAMLAEEVAQGDQQAIQKAAQIVGPGLMQAYLQGDERAQMMLGMFVQQNGQQVVETRNAVNELDVDIVIDEGMDTPTVQAEQFDTLTKMLPGMFPQGAPPPAIAMLIEASALRNKDKLLELMEQANAPDPMAEQMKQLQFAGAQAEVEKTQSETAKNMAQAQNAGGQPADPVEHLLRAAEIKTDQYAAVTDRMQAMQPERPKEAA